MKTQGAWPQPQSLGTCFFIPFSILPCPLLSIACSALFLCLLCSPSHFTVAPLLLPGSGFSSASTSVNPLPQRLYSAKSTNVPDTVQSTPQNKQNKHVCPSLEKLMTVPANFHLFPLLNDQLSVSLTPCSLRRPFHFLPPSLSLTTLAL